MSSCSEDGQTIQIHDSLSTALPLCCSSLLSVLVCWNMSWKCVLSVSPFLPSPNQSHTIYGHQNYSSKTDSDIITPWMFPKVWIPSYDNNSSSVNSISRIVSTTSFIKCSSYTGKFVIPSTLHEFLNTYGKPCFSVLQLIILQCALFFT